MVVRLVSALPILVGLGISAGFAILPTSSSAACGGGGALSRRLGRRQLAPTPDSSGLGSPSLPLNRSRELALLLGETRGGGGVDSSSSSSSTSFLKTVEDWLIPASGGGGSLGDQLVPVIASGASAEVRRVEDAFKSAFGVEPRSTVRAPGRVNLIGEHIDYSQYGVMPMALDLACHMAMGLDETGEGGNCITLCNVDGDRFPRRVLSPDTEQEIEKDWSGYFLCGYRGVFDVARRDGLIPEEKLARGLPGLKVMVSGRVPPGGGLSSSAAVVVASALVTAEALGIRLTKVQLASLCMQAEQYIGVLSGGMDQTASVMGLQNAALNIEFVPSLRAEPVSLPAGCVFVVANCMAKAEKAVQPLLRYNKRVVECMLGAKLLAKLLNFDTWKDITTLRDLQDQMLQRGDACDLDRMASLALELLPPGPCSREDLKVHLGGMDPVDLLPARTVMADVLSASDDFWIQERSVHVYREAARVHRFRKVCADGSLSIFEKVAALGLLMNESHDSLSNLYDCSCPELEELVAIAREAGAKGSRVTGAGWGGCSVSLVMESDVDQFMDQIKRKFYKGKSYGEGDLFVTKPAPGACIYRSDV